MWEVYVTVCLSLVTFAATDSENRDVDVSDLGPISNWINYYDAPHSLVFGPHITFECKID